jgi:hypothetical protein
MREAAMPNELMPDDPLGVWQNQPLENHPMQLEEIRRKARQFEKTIRNRNRREYIAALFVVMAFTYYIFKFTDVWIRAGSALIIAGTFYVMYQLYRRASPEAAPGDLGLTASLAFHRRELERQRDLLQSIWSWYLGPLVPGLLVFTKGVMQRLGPGILLFTVQAVFFGGVWWINRRGAKRLSRQIAELDNLGSQL